jgi:nucleotide-binding universal stress UspA family protein
MVNDYQTQQILIDNQIDEAQALLKRYVEEARSHGVLAESDYQIGDAGHLLCDVAKDWGADLIVVGRRGRTGLAEAFLGSVSNYVVHHAPCSVLVIQDVEP